jgi:L-asparaginase
MNPGSKTSILVIYTGGTIGMVKDPESGVLKPFNFDNIYQQIPMLKLLDYHIGNYCFDPVIDSSNMNPKFWAAIAEVIEKNYESYDGFVVLHGSDTMAYTASALSFMLENLNKPVVLTGSQLPLGMIRTDGRENFITSIEIAAARIDDTPVVPEVCIYFENQLLRGNRTIKYNAENFQAFKSPNYPSLADVGVYIKYHHANIRKPNFKNLKVNSRMDNSVSILKLYPGISENSVKAIVQTEGLKALILETFGSGNAPTEAWFLSLLEKTIKKGIVILNVSQCQGGSVEMDKYQTGVTLQNIGVISGNDITTEAAITKLMFLLANENSLPNIQKKLTMSLRGEITTN